MSLGISDATSYAGPYSVGDTITGNFSVTGGSGGPYTWTIGTLDFTLATVSGTDTHTGSSWNGPVLSLDAVSTTSQFIVEVYDATSVTYAYRKTSAVTVNAKARTVRTANYTATVAADGFQVIPCDASGGAFTVTLPTAAGNGSVFITPVKIDSSGNAVTVKAPGTEVLRGSAGGTITLAAQWASKTMKNNNLDTHYDT